MKKLKKIALVTTLLVSTILIPTEAFAGWRYKESQGYVGGTICDTYEYKLFGITWGTKEDCH